MNWNCILERVNQTESTNDDLMARWRAGELIDPVSRLARHQTKGKGRAGRAWFANPQSSLCFSLAYPFTQNSQALHGLSLACGLAVLQGIATSLRVPKEQLHDLGIGLKWPNDLLIHGKKLGGILIEGGNDDIINVGCEKITPYEIEEVVKQIPEVEDVAAFGIEHEIFGQVVKLNVVKSKNSDLDKSKILTHCMKNLEKFKIPSKIDFVESLPKTDYGKVKRFMLK